MRFQVALPAGKKQKQNQRSANASPAPSLCAPRRPGRPLGPQTEGAAAGSGAEGHVWGIRLRCTLLTGGFESSRALGWAPGQPPGTQCALDVLWGRLTARSLLPLEPKLQRAENRTESWVSPRKSDRQGLFYGEGEGAGSDASISGRTGTQSPYGGSPTWAEDSWGGKGRVRGPGVRGCEASGRDGPELGKGRPLGRDLSSPPARPVLSSPLLSPRAPSAIPGAANSPGPASQAGGRGRDFLPRNT